MKRVIFFALISCLGLAACVRTEKIEDFPIEKPKIVVNSFLKNNEEIEFFISKSLSSIDNAKIKKVSNAEISIYENDKLVEVITQESTNHINDIDAYFVSTIKPQIGKRYKISVSAKSLNTVTAESDLPPELNNVTGKIVKMDTMILHNEFNNRREDSTKYSVYIKTGSIILNIPDEPGVKNYYKINLKAEEKFWDGTQWDYRYRTIYIGNEGSDYNNYDNGLFLTDKLYEGKNIPVKLDIQWGNIQSAETKIKFKIIVSSQSEEKQKYDISVGQYYQNQDNPFVEPTLVYSNIIGGYGIFAGESEFEIILE